MTKQLLIHRHRIFQTTNNKKELKKRQTTQLKTKAINFQLKRKNKWSTNMREKKSNLTSNKGKKQIKLTCDTIFSMKMSHILKEKKARGVQGTGKAVLSNITGKNLDYSKIL